jgi:uncharacterized protein (DUF2249 family)
MSTSHIAGSIVDVRQVMPQMRHPLIVSTFDRLEPGASFLVVNDHDPRPLLYHFGVNYPGKFDWDYVAKGPEVWKVRISREAY